MRRRGYISALIFMLLVLTAMGLAVSPPAWGELQQIYVLKEIDEEHVIIVTGNEEKMLLAKLSLKTSPSPFEGRVFLAEVGSSMVTIYFEERDRIKWFIKKRLVKEGGALPPEEKKVSPIQTPKHYVGVGPGHWIQQKIDRGRILILEDGSIWEVLSTDIKDSARWSLLSEITLIKEAPHYYRLNNTSDGESVSARFLGQR